MSTKPEIITLDFSSNIDAADLVSKLKAVIHAVENIEMKKITVDMKSKQVVFTIS